MLESGAHRLHAGGERLLVDDAPSDQRVRQRDELALRERERVSQTVFANYLNVTPNLVSKWERGEKRPSGPALKLLSLVERHGIVAVA